MADEVDVANERATFGVDVALQNLRTSNKALLPVGSCYYCNEILPEGRLFCDVDCRDDYEAEQRAKARNGHGE